MEKGQGTETNGWQALRVRGSEPAAGYRNERHAEFALFLRVNSPLRTNRWQQVQKIHGIDITIHGFEFHQRGEQQCLYWQIPNIRAR
jgi:hypothetical protein